MIPLERRREAREQVHSPGKFEGEPAIVPILWDLILEGRADSENDCSCGCGTPLARVGRWILWESDQGFVWSLRYPTRERAQASLEGGVE